jgi:soluble lytic murein transglycosylase
MNQLARNSYFFNLKALAAVLSLLLFLWAANAASAGEIYSFVDDNGVMHFSNAPDDPRYSVSSGAQRYSTAALRKVGGTEKIRHARKKTAGCRSPVIRSPEISRLVSEAAGKHGVDPALVKAIIEVESGGRPDARSPKGAVGLMQLMPETARNMGVRDRTDSHQNIQGGTGYFRSLLEKFNGDIVLALAAYNAGPASVEKYNGIPPYLETVRYVRKVLEAWNRYRSINRTSN